MEFTDPNDGLVYEVIYNVTQTEDEGPEHVLWRLKTDDDFAWQKLPPFGLDPTFARKCCDEWFGPVHGWQHGIKASIVSDIEKIDKALDAMSEVYNESNVDLNIVTDALHDARSGLLYLSDNVKDLDDRLNKIHGWSTP